MILLPRMPLPAANRLLEAFLDDSNWSFDAKRLPDATRFAPTGGTRATSAQLQSLRDALLEKARVSGFGQNDGRNDFAKFDSEVAKWLAGQDFVHDSEALRDDVWAFVAIAVAPDIVQWRFGATPARYRGGIRNAFQRLWLRGRTLDRGRASGDRWQLVDALTEDAFVQILERPSLSAYPELARAIAEAWVRAAKRHGRGNMEGIMRRATLRIRIQNEIRLLTLVPAATLAELLDRTFDDAKSASPSSHQAHRGDLHSTGPVYRRPIRQVHDVLRANDIAIPSDSHFLELDREGMLLAVWTVLIGEGPLRTSARETVSICARRLRAQKWVEYRRLSASSEIYRKITAQLRTATRTGENGLFEIPRNSFVRAFQWTQYMTSADWQDCTMRAICELEEGTAASDDIVRRTFQVAQHRYGIESLRLGSSVRSQIEAAISACVESRLVARLSSSRLAPLATYAEPD